MQQQQGLWALHLLVLELPGTELPPSSCCTGRQSQGQQLLDRSHLHAFRFVPRDGCEQRVCMPGPAAGQRVCGALTNPAATLGTGVQPGVPGLDALRRGDLAGRARCPKLTCCPCLCARVCVATRACRRGQAQLFHLAARCASWPRAAPCMLLDV